jgi:hypothetical protein
VPDGGPYTAPSYAQLHTGTLSFGLSAPQTITAAGDPATSAQFDPIGGNSDACETISSSTAPGTATYADRRALRVLSDSQRAGPAGKLALLAAGADSLGRKRPRRGLRQRR